MDTIADYLRDHRFAPLFTDELGWEHASGELSVAVGRRVFRFSAIAHKRGLQVLACVTDPLALVNRGLLRKVQRRVAQSCHEHIVIYSCEQPRKQVWQWCIRYPDGRRLRHREHPFFSTDPAPGFVGRLARLRFTLDEEEGTSLLHALERVRHVLDESAEKNLFVRRPWYAERSAELIEAIKRGEPGAFHRFVELHMPLARKISQRLCRWFGMSAEDAAQIAYVGLLQGAHRYRPELGYQFSTYAHYWVKQACGRYGPEFAFLIRLPAHVPGPCFKLRRELDRVAVAAGARGVREFLTNLDLRDPKRGRQLRDFQRATDVRSLSDRRAPAYAQARQIATIAPTVVDDAIQTDRAMRLNEALDRLRPRQAQILRLRYGFDGCPPQSLAEVGALFGLTRERIRQIQQAAERRLRDMICERYRDLLISGADGDAETAHRAEPGGDIQDAEGLKTSQVCG